MVALRHQSLKYIKLDSLMRMGIPTMVKQNISIFYRFFFLCAIHVCKNKFSFEQLEYELYSMKHSISLDTSNLLEYPPIQPHCVALAILCH